MTDYAMRRRMMVDTQVRPSDVTKFPIIDAMLDIPRELFVPRDRAEAAYVSENVPLGSGRVLLEPRTFSKMLDVVNIRNNDLVLDVGAGLGYSSAVIARIAEAVVALEDDEARVAEAQDTLSDIGADNVVLQHGPLAEGAPDLGPFDAIIVEGGVETVPQALLDQLKEGGRMVCVFMSRELGAVRVGYKHDNEMSWRFAFNAGAPVMKGFEREQVFEL